MDSKYADKEVDQFPYEMKWVPMATHSEEYLQNSKKSGSEGTKKNVIIGGYDNGETQLHEIVINHSTAPSHVSYLSFKRDYNKYKADIATEQAITKADGAPLRNARHTNSFMIEKENKKYIIMLGQDCGYNGYDTHNDKWLRSSNSDDLNLSEDYYSRCTLITDEILVISSKFDLNIYCIKILDDNKDNMNDNDNNINGEELLQIKLLKNHKMKLKYNRHGMSCFDFVRDKENNKLLFKLALFGGSEIKAFLSSFTFFDISITDSQQKQSGHAHDDQVMKNDHDIKIVESVIDKKQIKCLNFNTEKFDKLKNGWMSIGFECISNYHGESVIVIIGGGWRETFAGTFVKSVCFFNTQTYEMVLKENILPFECGWKPSTTSYYDSLSKSNRIFIMHQRQHCLLQIYDERQWNVERIMWIGYNKNNDNQQCFLPKLPKAVLLHILNFLPTVIQTKMRKMQMTRKTQSKQN